MLTLNITTEIAKPEFFYFFAALQKDNSFPVG